MTTTLDIITRALVKCRVLGAGRTPKAQDAADGLKTLQELIDHLAGFGSAYPWVEAYEASARTICRDDPAVRVHAKTGAGAFIVTLPVEPRDGARFAVIDADGAFAANPLTINSQGVLFDATLTGAGEPTGGSRAAVVLNTSNLRRSWMYRADLCAWVRISELTLASAMPYPAEFDRSWRYMLSVELATDYGVTLEAEDYVTAQHGFSRLANRYVEPLPVVVDRALRRGLNHYGYPYG